MMNPVPRYDAVVFPVGNGFGVEVCRRDDRFGRGVCMSLHCGEVEVMRFDLFEPAHLHFAVEQGDAPRIIFPPGPIEQHVARALWDLRHNATAAIVMCSDARVLGRGPDWEAFDATMPAIEAALARAREGQS